MGPRRVGKTVLLHHCVDSLLKAGTNPRRITYVSVDHPLYNGRSLEQLLDLCFPESGGVDLKEEPAFVFFDEIQYLKDWERHLKAIVDDYPNLRAVASGSAAAALRLKSVESGAGRFTDFLLPPLTFYEYLELLDLDSVRRVADFDYRARDLEELNRQFVDYLNFGGYPEVVLSPEIRRDPAQFVKADIIDKVLLRDLPSLYGIQDSQELNSLFTALAFNTAGEVSLERLSKRSGVAKNTIKRYLEYLEATFLIRIVHRVDRAGRRFKRANFFKVYLTNPSMRCALFSPIGPDEPAFGALVESAVFAQWLPWPISALRYARWSNGEVDIVHVGPDERVVLAVEAKWSDRPVEAPHELRGAVSFCKANSLQRLRITTRSSRASREVGGIGLEFEPASEYCYKVGRNLIEHRLARGTPPRDEAAPRQKEIGDSS